MLKSIFASRAGAVPDKSAGSMLLPAEHFMKTLVLERKRTERSGRAFVLMILDTGRLLQKKGKNSYALAKLMAALEAVRDTDVKGWYRDGAAIGVIFTEIGGA